MDMCVKNVHSRVNRCSRGGVQRLEVYECVYHSVARGRCIDMCLDMLADMSIDMCRVSVQTCLGI